MFAFRPLVEAMEKEIRAEELKLEKVLVQ